MDKKWPSFEGFFVLIILSQLLSGCSSLLYYPDGNLYTDPNKLTPNPEEVHLDTHDKNHIHGWYFPSKNNKKICLSYFHGNAQNRSSHFMHLFWLVNEGVDYYIFDYPGYGNNPGKPTPENTVKAAKAAIRYVTKQNCKKHIVYGHSLGGQIAMRAVWELKDEFTPDLLVVDSSFLSYEEIGNKILKKSWPTWLFSPLAYVLLDDEWAIGERASKFANFPKVFIHTKTDAVVPFELGERAFKLASGPKEFWIKEKGHHNNIYYDEEGMHLRKDLLKRINETLDPSVKKENNIKDL